MPLSALMGCRWLCWLGVGRLDGWGWPMADGCAGRQACAGAERRQARVIRAGSMPGRGAAFAWGLEASLTVTPGAVERALQPLLCRALRRRREACAGLGLSIAAPAAKKLWADPRAPRCRSDRCQGCVARWSVAHRSAGAGRGCCSSSRPRTSRAWDWVPAPADHGCAQKPHLPGPVGGASAAGGAGEGRRPVAAAQRRRSSRSF